MATPTNLDGIAGAKRRLRQGLRRLRSQLEAMEELTTISEAEFTNQFLGCAHAAAIDVAHIIEDAAVPNGLLMVARATYKVPRELIKHGKVVGYE